MKKRLFLMAIAVALVSLMVGEATFAIFTDTAANTNNTFTAGTVRIETLRNQGDTVPGAMFYTTPEQGLVYNGDPTNPNHLGLLPTGAWAPGDSHERQLDVLNAGSIPVKLTKIKADVESTSDIQPGDAAYNEFINKMHIKVWMSGSGKVLYDGTLAGLLNGWVNIDPANIVNIAVQNNGSISNVHLTFTATLDKSAGNVLQAINPVFSFSIYAEQQ